MATLPDASCRVERDESKAKANVQRCDVSFEEASKVSADPLAILLPDPDPSHGEERFLVSGMSSRNRAFVVSHAERPPGTRLISARPATRFERTQYEEAG